MLENVFVASILLSTALMLMSGYAQRRGWVVEPDRPLTYSLVLLLPEVYLFLPFLMSFVWLGAGR